MDYEEMEEEFNTSCVELSENSLDEELQDSLKMWRIVIAISFFCLCFWCFAHFLPIQFLSISDLRNYFQKECCQDLKCKTSGNCASYFYNWIRFQTYPRDFVMKKCCYWFSPYVSGVSPNLDLYCNQTCLTLL